MVMACAVMAQGTDKQQTPVLKPITNTVTPANPPANPGTNVMPAKPPVMNAPKPILPEMITVEAGTFWMGNDSAEEKDEKPRHQVTLKSFKIGKFEVTQEQWQSVMGYNPSQFKCGKCPVEGVSYDDAQRYMNKLNQLTGRKFRLPTEAEWEYAAKGGKYSKGYVYAGSNNVDEVAWHNGNSGGQTNVVGLKIPNELALYDMSGNVSEWCGDWYDEEYYKKSPKENPKNTTAAAKRVLRGGNWGYNEDRIHTAYRDWDSQDKGRSSFYGFRLAED